jgi:hypothetical protein
VKEDDKAEEKSDYVRQIEEEDRKLEEAKRRRESRKSCILM